MAFSILAFRPAAVVDRLAPGNEACPLSLRDVLAAAVPEPFCLPLIRAPAALVARPALLAAQGARSALGLALPPGMAPERWFASMTEAADAFAPGLPIFFSGEVKVTGKGERDRERAFEQAYRLVDAGITHLAVDVGELAPDDRAEAFAEVAAAAAEREIGVECELTPQEGIRSATWLIHAIQEKGLSLDLASVPGLLASSTGPDARAGLEGLARLSAALGRTPILCRGKGGPDLASSLRRSPVKVCDDGGSAARAAARALAPDLAGRLRSLSDPDVAADPEAARNDLESGAGLPPEVVDRAEALAYVEVADFIDSLGAAGSAMVVRDLLARRMAEG